MTISVIDGSAISAAMSVFSTRRAVAFATIAESASSPEYRNDDTPFAEAYGILLQNACDGTAFQVRLKSVCLENNIPFTSSRLEKFRLLRENKVFAKKWERRRKQALEADVSWAALIDTLYAFIAPVWEACMNDTVFFGDWMPELGRYLDG